MAENKDYRITTKPNLFVMLFWYSKGIDGKGSFGFGTYVVLALIALIFLGVTFEDLAEIFAGLATVLVLAGGGFAFWVTASDYVMFKRMYCEERGIEDY